MKALNVLAGHRQYAYETGDVLDVLGKLPDKSINGVFTSPPYFALRNYDNDEWEGGNPDCDHKPEPDKVARRAVSSSRLQGGKSTQYDAEAGRSGFDGTCGKCGARRVLRWQGGDPNCEHDRGGRDWTPQTKWQAAGEAVPKQASHRGAGDTCLKCGAVYVNPELGAEQTPDCMAWTRLEEPYVNYEHDDLPEILYRTLDEPKLCGKCYVCRLVAVFREIRRVLRDDGVAWLNLGDTMNGYPANAHSAGPIREKVQHARQMKDSGYGLQSKGLKELDSIGIPHRVAMALQADGWYWRTSVVWAKISVMPESVGGWRWEQHRVYPESFNRWADEQYGTGNGTRMSVPEGKKKKERCPGCDKCLPNDGLVLCTGSWRPTHSHEFIIQLAKNPKYFTDPLAVRQLPAEASLKRIRQPNFWLQHGGDKDMRNWDENTSRSSRNGLENFANNPGRNLWDVWVVPPQPVKEAHFACVDGETECLTAKGWKKYNEIEIGELAAQFDINTEKISWAPIEDIFSYAVENEPMIMTTNRDAKMLLTPNHRTIVSTRGTDLHPWKVVRADQLKSVHMIPISGEWDFVGITPVTNEMAELLGWYVAEGRENKRGVSVELYQSISANPTKVDRIREILVACNAEFEEARTIRMYNGHNVVEVAFQIQGFVAIKLRQLAPKKKIETNILLWSKERLQAFMSGFVGGDGHVRPEDGRISIVQKEKHTVDIVQAVAVRLGYATKSTKHQTQYRLYFSDKRRLGFRGTGGAGKHILPTVYTGIVWCPKLPKGTWIAKRDGRTFITGNTFPGGLPELAIRASISQGGYCNQCGKPFARIVKRDDAYDEAAGISETSESKWVDQDKQSSGHRMRKNVDAQRRKGRDHDNPFPVQQTVGWKPTCKCVDPQPMSGVMLDPFSGSGTTVRVAKALGVRGIGIDLNARYNKIADKLIDSAKLIIPESHAAQHEQQTLF